jgi:protein MpaA
VSTSPPSRPGSPPHEGDEALRALTTLALPVLGLSTEGRPITGGTWGPEDEAPLLVVGGVHGDEPSSVLAVVDLVAGFAASPPALPLVVVPALNPDGIAVLRKNSARDVDLNRNFPARNFSRQHAPGYDPGPAPLSEPETALLATLIERRRPAGIVAVHAPFACVNFDGPAAAWAEQVARATGWPARADIGYPTPGSLGSWAGLDLGLPVLTLELPPGPHRAFAARALAGLQAAINHERFG